MSRKTLMLVLVVAILGGVGFVAFMKPANMAPTTPEQQTATPTTAPPAPAVVQKGQYIGYSEQLVATTKGTKWLFFHAPWCPQCRDLDANIKATPLPDNLTIFKVDYDSNHALRQKYGVTIQTTIVHIDDAGNKIASYVAYNEPSYAAVARVLLP